MAEKEYIDLETAYDMDTLYDWYISSVSENDNPVWTEEHLEELLNDFYVIPKDTPTADVAPVVRCKDCKYNGTIYCPTFNDNPNGKDWQALENDEYCSYGLRKELDNG